VNPRLKSFKGTLHIEGSNSYLVISPVDCRSILLFLNKPTGAGFLDGFREATDFLQRSLKKDNGERISIRGVKSRFGGTDVVQFFHDCVSLPTDVRAT
jgi:hypothetical protein